MATTGTGLCVLVGIGSLLMGCSFPVTERYPRWGEEIELTAGAAPTLSLRILSPPRRPEACLLILHGMNEYVGRYGDIARHFSRRFLVAGVDLRAHGLSNPVLARADAALAQGKASFDARWAFLEQASLRNLDPLRSDLDRALRYLADRCDHERNGDRPLPLFILSHSLGSLVAATYLLEHGTGTAVQVKGIVLVGPAFSVPHVPGWRGWLQNPWIALSFFAEEHFLHDRGEPMPLFLLNQLVALPTVALLNGLFEVFSWPGLRELFSPSTPDWVPDSLTDDPQERARHRADGYIIRRTVLRYVRGVEKEIVRFRRRMAEFSVPYLLISAAHDPITSAWGNRDFARLTRSRHGENEVVELADYGYHEQMFSKPPLREILLRRIETWLDSRLDHLRAAPTPK